MKIEGVLIVDPVDGEYVGDVHIENGKIVDIELSDKKTHFILMPGFIDIHTHGAVGVDFLESKDWEKVGEFFYSQGVTTFFPTSVSTSLEKMLEFLDTAGEKGMYAHLEGPYISIEKKGAQNPEYIREATLEEIEKLLEYKSLKTITLAPEVNDPKVIEEFERNGVRVSLGHSNARYSETMEAHRAGARRITHFPNALRSLHHREIGISGAGLLEDFYLELITDGIHVSKEMIKLLHKVKGCDRIILITDSISATGLEDGEYELGGLRVFVKDGTARLEDGTLAGSTLTFSRGLRNFREFTGCSLKCLSKISSYNAAVHMELNGKGRISKGFDADFVVLDMDLNIVEVYRNGRKFFQNS